jgi:hypothetical protein
VKINCQKSSLTSSRVQKRHQTTLTIQRYQIIATTHMGLANENLRHCTPATDFHHFGALGRVRINPDFLKVINAPVFEQLLGANAIGAGGGGVNFDSLHSLFFLVF